MTPKTPTHDSNATNALRNYVKECTLGTRFGKRQLTVQQHVDALLEAEAPLETSMVLWRGQTVPTIQPTRWFSCAANKSSAREFMETNESCCLFKIHVLAGIRVLNVHALLDACGKSVESMRDEDEWIVAGGGTFYRDALRGSPGFQQIAPGVFETWYGAAVKRPSATRRSPRSSPRSSPTKTRRSPKSPRTVAVTADQLIHRIPEDEYELYADDTWEQIRDDVLKALLLPGETATDTVYREVASHIKQATATA